MEENGKISIARQRWKLLAQVITRQPDYLTDPNSNYISVRRFRNFGLLEVRVYGDGIRKNTKSIWLEYTSQDYEKVSCMIRQFQGNVSLETLLGFNNTGNVCVWPAEEVMTYYCLKHKDMFRSKVVCELGGGMTCLAGVFVSLVSEAEEMVLTDGNEDSVNNLHYILEKNKDLMGKTKTSASLLRWGPKMDLTGLKNKFDTILCADCLFFDEGREDLITLLHEILKPGGQAYMFAPTRGNTFHEFQNLSERSFQVQVQKKYDDHVWKLHSQLLSKGNDLYNENLHYPLLMILTKPISPEKWKSNNFNN